MKDRKIVLVGTGFVGMSMAYSFLTTGGIDELVLVDVDEEKAIGETMDLQHGLPYAAISWSSKPAAMKSARMRKWSSSRPEQPRGLARPVWI